MYGPSGPSDLPSVSREHFECGPSSHSSPLHSIMSTILCIEPGTSRDYFIEISKLDHSEIERRGSYLISVFYPEEELALVDPRKEVVVEGRPEASNVQVTRRGRCIPHSHLLMFMCGIRGVSMVVVAA